MKGLSLRRALAAVPATIVMIAAGVADGLAQARPALELLETKTSQTQSAIEVVGQVKNISPRPVEGVTVSCDFQDASGRIIKTEQGMLATDPLAPDKTSQFKCSTASNSAIKGFKVRFAQLFGGPLAMKDSRK